MNIQQITNKQDWEKVVFLQDTASFLQSWDWGEFQAAGALVFRLQLPSGRVFQIFRYTLPFGLKFDYLPRVKIEKSDILSLQEWSKAEGSLLLRIEPINQNISGNKVKSKQPRHTLILDLTLSDDTLLQKMHKKTRYNIRLAQKKDIHISYEKDINIFWELNNSTTARDGFKSHNKKYYERMFALPLCYQITAFIGKTAIASNIMMVYGNTCTYLHGTSDHNYREYMAPYLLQWEGIKFGKKQGCKFYDFWGTAAWKTKTDSDAATFHDHYWDAKESLASVTRFKAGFGGKEVSYGEAIEIPAKSIFYKFMRLVKKFL